ncbi:MAG: RHS repeat-associated core domain-containing protein [Gemmatales bacterium]|nr:RHS repeat-associated core domain-containing protein [Gemmatales bacterium]
MPGPIALSPDGWAYHLGDALGSVRQLADAGGGVTLARSYEPYGSVQSSAGGRATMYGFTGEAQSGGLVYLRARYYAPSIGRFLSRDTWVGDDAMPMSFNKWLYGYSNPLSYSDPTGNSPCSLLPPDDRQDCENITTIGNKVSYPNPQVEVVSQTGLVICTNDLVRHGELCIPVHCLYPADLLHPLASEPSIPRSNKGLGKWFHYLLQNVPGWWNRDRKAKREEVVLNLIALSFATEVSEDEAYSGNLSIRRLVGYMAEAYARKAWSWSSGFYSFIGSREAVFNRMMPTLFVNLRPDPNNPTKTIGDWEINERAKRFANMMNALQRRLNYGQHYARLILYTPSWHQADANRPYEWGNVKEGNPVWFKQWINVQAPMLADGKLPLDRAHPGSAIWYAAPRGAPLANGTGYVMTKAQQEELCNAYEQGCVGMPNTVQRPSYIPVYNP